MTPTARTLNLLRAEGWTCQVVESWIPRLNLRRDLFGIGDVLAMDRERLLLVQCTSDGNVSARIHKAQSEPRLRVWLAHPSRTFEVWGWDGKRCRRVPVVLDDVQDVVTPIRPERRKPRRKERGLFDRIGGYGP